MYRQTTLTKSFFTLKFQFFTFQLSTGFFYPRNRFIRNFSLNSLRNFRIWSIGSKVIEKLIIFLRTLYFSDLLAWAITVCKMIKNTFSNRTSGGCFCNYDLIVKNKFKKSEFALQKKIWLRKKKSHLLIPP